MLFPNITPRTGFSILFCTGIIFTPMSPTKLKQDCMAWSGWRGGGQVEGLVILEH